MAEGMHGKTVMVTGATDGIGLVTARELAAQGARVLLVGRNGQKGRQAMAAIRERAAGADLAFHRADLSRLADIRRLAQNVAESEPRLDVLVNNAGAIFDVRQETEDGFERTFALNHLNYFLLTDLLLEPLRAAPAARVVNVASRAHAGAEMPFHDLHLTQGYKAWRAYKQSKLANILFTRALAKRLETSTVTANALHPGFVRTRFGGDNPTLFRMGVRLAMAAMAISVEEGAKTPIFLASSPAVAGRSGGYYVKNAEARPDAAAADDAAAERLWDMSRAMVGGR